VLALTEGAEIVRALREEFFSGEELAAPEPRTLPSGLVVTDLRLGGGASPSPGDFLGLRLTVSTASPEGEVVYLLGSEGEGRPASFIFNKAKRPAAALAGLEEAVADMTRGGVRDVVIPANVGLKVKVAGAPIRGALVPPTGGQAERAHQGGLRENRG
jgi:FKBP-type peptidyl-prolyl cis-trans isomerase